MPSQHRTILRYWQAAAGLERQVKIRFGRFSEKEMMQRETPEKEKPEVPQDKPTDAEILAVVTNAFRSVRGLRKAERDLSSLLTRMRNNGNGA